MAGAGAGTKLVSVQAIPASGSGYMSATVASVDWARTQGRALGVRVINLR
jgi:hypothetical protein